MISLYTDGSSTGRSNREGGWGVCVAKDDQLWFGSYGGHTKTTSNVMELTAALQALKMIEMYRLDLIDAIEIVSDSQYVIGLATGLFTPKSNKDLAVRVRHLTEKYKCPFRWTKGHDGDKFNELADKLAKRGKEEHRE